MDEEAGRWVVGGCEVGGVVSDVDADLCTDGAAEKGEVGVEGVLGGQHGDGHLDAVGGVLEGVLHVDVEPSGFQVQGEDGLVDPERPRALMDGEEGVVPGVVAVVVGPQVELHGLMMLEKESVALGFNGFESQAVVELCIVNHPYVGAFTLGHGAQAETGGFCAVEEACRFGMEAAVGATVGVHGSAHFAADVDTPAVETQCGFGKGVEPREHARRVAFDDSDNTSRSYAGRHFQRVAPAVVGIGVVGPEDGG